MKWSGILFAAVLTGLLCLVYATCIERENVQIEEIELRVLPSALDGLRIVHISDLHIDSVTPYERKVARMVNSTKPDIIAITGDFFKNRNVLEGANAVEKLPANIDQIESFLDQLQANIGIYACRGNNDFSDDKEVSDVFLERLHETNVTMLTNTRTTIIHDGQRIHLLGVDFPGFDKSEIADFYVHPNESGYCIESGASTDNSFSHFMIRGERTAWRDYTFSGRCRQLHGRGGIGITFYSQLDAGFDRFYRLRYMSRPQRFLFSPHGAASPLGITECPQSISSRQWCRFKIHCYSEAQGVRMQARVWADGSAEPTVWHVDAMDTTRQFEYGTVGLWSRGQDVHQFDDLCVVDASGDTLLFEDFEDGDAAGWLTYNHEGSALPWLAQAIPDSEFSMVLAHSPDLVHWADSAKIDLQLSGHTHGGQVQLPFWGALFSSIKLGRKYTEGLFQFDHTTLYINRGIGTVLLPIRFFCRPEITVIDLKSE
ncbi:metallophosphoesterase [candidate division KSB1 bacterium]|nr:metallophosphoesterase [candidate division KSB1 bacterium]